jgi:hypothetical protein
MPWRRIGSGCIDPRFLDPGSSWKWVVSFTPRPLYPRYPPDRGLGGLQNRSALRGEVKILAPTGTQKSEPLVVQPVASRYTDCAIPALQEGRSLQNTKCFGSWIRFCDQVSSGEVEESYSFGPVTNGSCCSLTSNDPNRVRSFLQPPPSGGLAILDSLLYVTRFRTFRTSDCAPWKLYQLIQVIRMGQARLETATTWTSFPRV